MSLNEVSDDSLTEIPKRCRSDSNDIEQVSSKRFYTKDDKEIDDSPFDNVVAEYGSEIGGSMVLSSGSYYDNPYFAEEDLDPWTYDDVVAAAPMVRVSTLPFRLVCKNFGCDMMYSEEIIALKMAKCSRFVTDSGLICYADPIKNSGNKILNESRSDTISRMLVEEEQTALKKEYPSQPGNPNVSNPTLVTYPQERIVLQLGVGSGVDAIQAAAVCERDVRAFDVNMGCPKLFSLQGAMGAALLNRPEVVEDIIKSLKRNVKVPVTAKIRMLPDERDTVELVRRLDSLGVAAIGVHCRFKEDRPRFRALPLLQMPLIRSSVGCNILYNGDIYTHSDINRYRVATQAHGVLIGRGSIFNPSIFGGNGTRLFRDVDGKPLPHTNFSRFYGQQSEHNLSPNLSGIYDPTYDEIMNKYVHINTASRRSSTPLSRLSPRSDHLYIEGNKPYEAPLLSSLPDDTISRRTEPDSSKYVWEWPDHKEYLECCADPTKTLNNETLGEHMLPIYASAHQYLRFSHAVGNAHTNTKYFLAEMLKQPHKVASTPGYQQLLKDKSHIQYQNTLMMFKDVSAVSQQYAHPYPPNKFHERPHDLYKERAKGKKGGKEAALMKSK